MYEKPQAPARVCVCLLLQDLVQSCLRGESRRDLVMPEYSIAVLQLTIFLMCTASYHTIL